jgi:hypothetical protein
MKAEVAINYGARHKPVVSDISKVLRMIMQFYGWSLLMIHPYVVSKRNQTLKFRDRVQNVRSCVLIVLAISIMISIGSAHAQPRVGAICPMFIMKISVWTSKPFYSVGDEIIILWKPVGSGVGQLTLKGPSGTYQYNLDQATMSAGQYDAGTTQQQDVGSWNAYLQYNPAPGCQANIYGGATFKVTSGTSPSTSACSFTLYVSPDSQTVQQGGTADFALSVTFSNPSYDGTQINMQLAGLGPGMNYEQTASSVAITTSPTTPPGDYAISLMASGCGATYQTGMTVTVTSTNPAPTTTTTVASIVTTAITQTATVQPSPTSTETSTINTQSSTSDIIGFLQQNNLPVIGVLIILVLALAAFAFKERKSSGTAVQIQPQTISVVYCSRCGAQNSNTDNFCKNCGTKLG